MGDNKKGYFKKTEENGSINISEEVITVIAATAAVDVEGVHGLFVSHGREITHVDKNRGLYKGVRLNNDNNKLNIDIYIVAKMGYPINELGSDVQKAVVSTIEDTAGLKVNEINVHVCGVALKKPKAAPPVPAVTKKPAEKKKTEGKTPRAKKIPPEEKSSEKAE